jgi:succinate dehydrogenase/fumarate reductase flavoprotein subunit
MALVLSGRDEVADLVVVGAGAAGMTAALVAARHGLRVVLCEATEQVGGTTATSAGTLWIPGNRHGQAAGCGDTVEAGERYLAALLGPDDPRGLRRAFLATGDEAIAWLEAHSQVRFTSSGTHPDYLVQPGAALAGRALSPLPFDGRRLGADFARVRPPIPEFMLLGGMMVGKADIQALVRRWSSLHAAAHGARLVLRYLTDRLGGHARGTRLVMGNALVARLLASVRDAGVDLRFGWRLQRLVLDAGRVAGAVFDTAAGSASVLAVRGVVLATGGIGHHPALRAHLLPDAVPVPSLAADGVAGEGVAAGLQAGAALETHEPWNFFWQPVSRVPRPQGGHGLFPHLYLDRAKPGLIAVDEAGQRFVNEAASYHHVVEGWLDHARRHGRRHAWLVCDADFVRRYGLGVIPPGTRRLARWQRCGYVRVAPSLEALAAQAGIDAAGLARTVAATNEDAHAGVDRAFGKGQAPLDRFNGDPSHAPNPCLGPIRRPPFVALPILPADAAASAGLATDADGRVLDAAGAPLPGLYACGNDAASLMRGRYPGPGITLGPAVVFAYRAARHVAAAA